MINNNEIRTRFAPSPSGIIHIGNLRSALISFLCARENQGKFLLRIEDTDQSRTEDSYLKIIYKILDIMKIIPDEGPLQNGPYGPYIQSERFDKYNQFLNLFFEKNLIYRCFKTPEELEHERNLQISLKQPPRYHREILSIEQENNLLKNKKPFIWRLKLSTGITTIQDKAKGEIKYNLINFADCPITRQDGSFTFLFANFVDDVLMKINYVIRGEEHLSNTAIQSYMYDVLNIEKPIYYHLPLICDENGKKLSKRNFGFNIQDLLLEGYLPEAILNYIAIIGANFKTEIMSLEEMITNKIFSQIKSTGFITYDPEKLLWINSKWIQKISSHDFIYHLKNYLNYQTIEYEYEKVFNNQDLIEDIKKESKTIKEFLSNINFIINNNFSSTIENKYKNFIQKITTYINNENKTFLDYEFLKIIIKDFTRNNNVAEKELYNTLRIILINKKEGISIKILIKYINKEKILENISKINFTE